MSALGAIIPRTKHKIKTLLPFSRRQPTRPPYIPSYQLTSSLCVTMHPLSWLLGLVVLPAVARAWSPASSSITDALAADSLDNLLKLVSNGTLKSYLATQNVSQTCTEEKVARRKDYTTLSQEERLDYVTAMKCLMDAPALTPSVSSMQHQSAEQLADGLSSRNLSRGYALAMMISWAHTSTRLSE